jgi:predicted outer membrane repeat protein
LRCEALERRDTPNSYTVNTCADTTNVANGLDAGGTTSLRSAIEAGNAAGGGNTINFDPTVFPAGTVPIQIPVQNDKLNLTANFTISGPTDVPVQLTPIYLSMIGVGTQTFPIMEIASASTTSISYLNFSGARWTQGPGGAIYNTGILTVDHCTITDCQAVNGGGIANSNNLTLTNSNLDGNQAPNSDGGGLFCAPNAGCTASVTNTVFSNNQASKGGGIAVLPLAQLTMAGGQVYHNSSVGQGGGIYSDGTITWLDGLLNSNSAGDGGGLYNSGGTTTFNGVTVQSNTANWGGGVWAKNGSTTNLNGCYFSGNSATTGGSKIAYTGTIDVTTFVNIDSNCTGVSNADRELVT